MFGASHNAEHSGALIRASGGRRPLTAATGYELALQPPVFTTRCVDAGYLPSSDAGRMGRGEKLPPQLGHSLPKTPDAQNSQNVHSNVQITASLESGGKSLSQHSQLGLNSSIEFSVLIHNAFGKPPVRSVAEYRSALTYWLTQAGIHRLNSKFELFFTLILHRSIRMPSVIILHANDLRVIGNLRPLVDAL